MEEGIKGILICYVYNNQQMKQHGYSSSFLYSTEQSFPFPIRKRMQLPTALVNGILG